MNEQHSYRAAISLLPEGTRWVLKNTRTVVYIFRSIFSHIMDFYVRPPILKKSIKHIYGLREINYAEDDLIVLCVVKNGEIYIKSFIEHYFSLGVKHIVFLFNDSTDNSIALASQYENVTILETNCQFKKYENVMRRYLVNRFSRDRWNLLADIDELFDYPFSDVINLKLLLTYLNQKKYTAVVAQMLDLFSDKSLANLTNQDNSLKEIYIYYDISNLQKSKYNFGFLSNQNIKFHSGGIRKTLFSTDNGLTKTPLTFLDRNIRTFVGIHHVKNAHIADFTCVLLHYPFTRYFYQKVMDAVKTKRYLQSADYEYKMYWERLKKDPDINIKQETAFQLENVNSLVESDFLVVSEDYMQWVKNNL